MNLQFSPPTTDENGNGVMSAQMQTDWGPFVLAISVPQPAIQAGMSAGASRAIAKLLAAAPKLAALAGVSLEPRVAGEDYSDFVRSAGVGATPVVTRRFHSRMIAQRLLEGGLGVSSSAPGMSFGTPAPAPELPPASSGPRIDPRLLDNLAVTIPFKGEPVLVTEQAFAYAHAPTSPASQALVASLAALPLPQQKAAAAQLGAAQILRQIAKDESLLGRLRAIALSGDANAIAAIRGASAAQLSEWKLSVGELAKATQSGDAAANDKAQSLLKIALYGAPEHQGTAQILGRMFIDAMKRPLVNALGPASGPTAPAPAAAPPAMNASAPSGASVPVNANVLRAPAPAPVVSYAPQVLANVMQVPPPVVAETPAEQAPAVAPASAPQEIVPGQLARTDLDPASFAPPEPPADADAAALAWQPSSPPIQVVPGQDVRTDLDPESFAGQSSALATSQPTRGDYGVGMPSEFLGFGPYGDMP